MLNAPEIQVGDVVHFCDDCPSSSKIVDKQGIVLSIYNNENYTGKILKIRYIYFEWVWIDAKNNKEYGKKKKEENLLRLKNNNTKI